MSLEYLISIIMANSIPELGYYGYYHPTSVQYTPWTSFLSLSLLNE
jgi:hypothetical protein